MITFLASLFIKERHNYSSPAVRQAYGVLSGAVGIGLNILLFLGQMDCRNGEWFYCYYGRCV